MSEALRVLIVDDEAPARSRLKELLQDCAASQSLELVGEAANGNEALEFLAQSPADVVLLDIRMPGMDGIEAAQHMQCLPQPPAVIFVTAYDHYAVQAFEVNAIDYLLKPVRAERLLAALFKAKALVAGSVEALRGLAPQGRTNLSVYERNRIVLVPVEEIVYLRAELKYVTVRTAEREYLVEESLSHLEQEFDRRFVRIHRNCLVAKAYVEGFERQAQDDSGEAQSGWVVVLNGIAERLPISRRQQHIVKEFGRS
ncbi:LytTR family two component transcriptional regulator [Sulfuricella denitrificans skB26]|uniref:LytTR family two component transcriptional regulator n=1 Tax=Sulfuricella denitrificans (strain DSM 22764 / NBRC 105220 / skB26) TaxID=1163617 RepID=S6ANW8_SULDS|nr:LytTR family DNA-binding domain-containing protein [Sulfuricella denitrificans]BAN36599.1 LytTR family two component transcriptional regulator [Sulfuricella denitrificans skB26]